MLMQVQLPERQKSLYLGQRMDAESFAAFCADNPELVIEREADGRVKIMSPVSPLSGSRENEIATELGLYARKHGGWAYSSSTGFTLPDGSVKSPDACYVSAAQISKFTKEELRHFAPIVPEFVVEVVSPSDTLTEVAEKVRDTWITNGVRLAWLVDVDADKLWVYRADHSVELVTPLDRTITGEDVLPGFTFDLKLLS
jgi:Uma2 family endonuclease